MSAIEISGLSKDYPVGFWRKSPRRALDRLSLRVESGEVFGFLGPNGAGKTTTIKLLTGLIFPTEGTASILDRPIGAPAAFRSLGYLPENPYFYDYLTAAELLNYFGRFFPMTAEERRRRVETVLEQAGLTESRDVALRKFSKGMMQRIGIAQAVLHNPEIVLLDEPMSGLDPVGRRDVRNLILRLKAEGKTVFFSTHILSDAEALCDRVAILNRGKLVGVGQIAGLLQRQSGYEAVLECASPGVSAELLPRLQTLCNRPVTVSGGHHRAEVSEEKLRELLALSTKDGVRLLSLNPLRFSLEDYFVELLQGGAPSREAVTPREVPS
jgi:ABC-2 type transport system ATP-binding protein